jgi:hypothetical protein
MNASGRFLLSDAEKDDLAIPALLGRGAQQWLSDLLLGVALGEVANGNAVGCGPTVNGGHVRLADLAESS